MSKEAMKLALEALAVSIPTTAGREAMIALGKAIAETEKQEQGEPVAIQMDVIVVNLVREGINKHRARELAEHFIKHTTPQPAQKPLTDEQILRLLSRIDECAVRLPRGLREFARAIEAAHGIKENT
jgi:hypothetical protein